MSRHARRVFARSRAARGLKSHDYFSGTSGIISGGRLQDAGGRVPRAREGGPADDGSSVIIGWKLYKHRAQEIAGGGWSGRGPRPNYYDNNNAATTTTSS